MMLSIGIDISKGKSMLCGMKPYGEAVIPPREIPHTEEAVQKLISQLQTQSEEVRIVMESTGAYHLPLLQSLQEAGFLFAWSIPC